jgi:8-amino-7-oxononanoate synthase
MQTAEELIRKRLREREDNGSLRILSYTTLPIDFCSNDYLGFARSETLKARIEQLTCALPQYRNGATGSRLLSGNHKFTIETENYIADFHRAQAGLVFNSGYDANLGLLSSLPQTGDTIIADELIHASLIDGSRLSKATRYTFTHNDLDALESKLKLATGIVYVLIESVYSMEGGLAPLTAILQLCQKYQANLIVDEAHALGILGKHGKGLVNELGLEDQVFARIVTFGKALGCHGAIVLGSEPLKQYLVNFARSFIYTTAAPLHNLIGIRSAYEMLTEQDHQPKIAAIINSYKQAITVAGIPAETTPSAIQNIQFRNNEATKSAAKVLQNQGIDVRAILSPTVPRGKERLRICLHTFNTIGEIQQLVKGLSLLKS